MNQTITAAHAVLSPSGAERWLNCTPSARLEQQFSDSAGDAAREGTLAHSIGELLIRYKTKRVTKKVFSLALETLQADRQYEPSMLDYADDYAVYVIEKLADAQSHTEDAMLFLEQKLNLTDYIPEGFGTGDSVIIADTVMDIIDLKYGKGVPVSAENNKQMMLYALGALREFDYMYDIRSVRMTIYQPRLDNNSTFEMQVDELKAWAETELKPRAALAFEGIGDFAPGTHCRFCKARGVCRAFADLNLELAVHDFKDPDLLNDEEIASILDRADMFSKWLSGVEEYALNEAVNNGKQWPGYKLVEGKSNRIYSDEAKVIDKLVKAGFKEDTLFEKKILGIGKMEKAITKKVFAAELTDLIIKPPGKPCLVKADDKRSAYNSAENARADFSEN